MTLPDFEFTLGGIVMGPGTAYEIISVAGLGNPAPSVHDLPLINGGVYPARDVVSPKVITLKLEMVGTAVAPLLHLPDFATAWAAGSNSDTPLTWHIRGITLDRHVNGRSRGWDFTLDQPAGQGLTRVVAQFFAPDGTIYDSTNTAVVF